MKMIDIIDRKLSISIHPVNKNKNPDFHFSQQENFKSAHAIIDSFMYIIPLSSNDFPAPNLSSPFFTNIH